MGGISSLHADDGPVFLIDFLFGMDVIDAVPAANREGIEFLFVQVLPRFVVADDIRVQLVTGNGIRVVNEVRGVASWRSHVAFKADELALLS